MTDTEKKIRVLVVSAQVGESTLFQIMINRTENMACSGIILKYDDTLKRLPDLRPDVIITNFSNPGAADFLKQVRQVYPETGLVVIDGHSRASSLLNVGKLVLVTIPITRVCLQTAIRDVYHGKTGWLNCSELSG